MKIKNYIAGCQPSTIKKRVALTFTLLSTLFAFAQFGGGGSCPDIPPVPTVTNNCGSTTLTRGLAFLGPDEAHYWQSSSNGTSTANSNSSITLTSGSVYYIRAYNSSTQCWSNARSVSYTVNAQPATPAAPSVSQSCGSTVLTRSSPPSGETWYWQTSSNGTSTANSNSSITLTSGTVYYLRARTNSGGCWSSARTVNYTVYSIPTAPAAPTVTNNCGSTTLTRGNPPAGVTWYWQSQINGTSTLNADPSISFTSGSVSYLRGQNNSSGCWGATTTINYSVNQELTWYRDADNDQVAISAQTFCGNPGAGYTQTVLPLGDLNDSDATITNIPPQNFYPDTDGDGYGDPGATPVYQSNAPVGHVADNTDQCPTVAGSFNGCPADTYIAPVLTNENYVYTRTYQSSMTSSTQIDENADVLEKVVYFDGIGRAKQQLAIKAAPNGKDILSPVYYDQFGRTVKEYLPYSAEGSKGSFRTADQEQLIKSYYKELYPDDFTNVFTDFTNPYSEKQLESSPLNRVLKQAAPGKDWQLGAGNEIEFVYAANTHDPANETDPANDNVRRYGVTFIAGNTEDPQLTTLDTGYYKEGDLFKMITKDENHPGGTTRLHTTEEYKDKLGRVVLKRTYATFDINQDGDTNDPGEAEVAHDTYYVYDDFGNLTYVIPPKVDTSNGVSTTELSELCYQYKYDRRNRLVEKKIPGKGWEYIVYNKLDQPVMTQDANLRAQNKWLFTKYDAWGRIAYSGIHTQPGSVTRQTMQGYADTGTYTEYETRTTTAQTWWSTTLYYTNNSIPKSNNEVLQINYYDSYTHSDGLSLPSSVYGQSFIANTRGMPTVNRVKVLETNSWVVTITGYDQKGRAIYTATKNNYLNTTDTAEMQLDFAGKTLETKTSHTKSGNTPIVVTERFTYDHAGRLTKQTHQIGSGSEELLARNGYDKTGQLTIKNVGNNETNSLQTVNFTYNIRGWMKAINDIDSMGTDLFAFKLSYNEGNDALYNGNISSTSWKTANANTNLHSYDYSYDALNRITGAVSSDTGKYDVSNISYDKMGNIQSLHRKGHTTAQPDIANASHFGDMDVLTYQYDSGNKLIKVTDTGNSTYGFKDGANLTTEYTYDANGNMLKDRNKGIGTSPANGITYNHLNLPAEVKFNNSSTQKINYVYDATGIKHKKTVTNGATITTTDYAGNYIYENGNLQFFNTAEGYVEENGSGGFDYIYQYKDHLGNIRLSYQDADGNGSIDASTEIISEKNYYPFGITHSGYNNVVSANSNSVAKKFGFADEELEEELGKNTIAYQWRDYDPAIGRFNKIDRFANKYDNLTPYHYTANNPIYYKEIRGDSINVAVEYQKQFRDVLTSLFGDNASDFSFNKSNNLVYNGNKKNFSKAQKKLFEGGFSDVLNEETTTNIIFEETYDVKDENGNLIETIDTNNHGGEGTIVGKESGLSENYIVVNTKIKSIKSYSTKYFNPNKPISAANRLSAIAYITNPSLLTVHGIGHVLNPNKKQSNVIDFENIGVRAFNDTNGTGIKERDHNENHGKNKKTNFTPLRN
ncbi:DUF6443 domain-containing protein [Flavobacteriaceae bacterium M23B6Z8]